MTRGLHQASKNDLDEALERYLAYFQLEKGASARTQESYERDLRQCLAFLRARGVRRCEELTMVQISAFLAELTSSKTRELKVASVARKITALRMFLRHLFVEKVLKEDFTERIATPRVKRKLPHTLTLGQVEKLLAAIGEGTPAGLRDRAILELLFSSGLRVSELCALTLHDFDLEAGLLRVMGKGSKERIVPVGSRALEALKHYLEAGRNYFLAEAATPFIKHAQAPKRTPTKKLRETSAVFIGAKGGALARCAVWYALKVYAKRAGVPTELVKPHALRHSFATELLKGGADLRIIQGLLGHSSISTTQIYTAVEPQHLIETHALYHPRKGMRV